MSQLFVKNYNKGLVTKIEEQSIARGSASDSLNWMFHGDHVELRRGQSRLGTEITTAGAVTGLRVARKRNGTQVAFWTQGRKAYYYNTGTSDNTEISSDLFPSAASGEDISIEPYNSLAGSFVYLTSPNSSIYKIPVANPGSVVDLLSTTYRGKMRVKQARMCMWDRKDDFGGSDKTGIHLSYVDQTTGQYDFTSAEVLGTGNGATKTYTGTLAFKASNSKETCFFVVIAAAKTTTKVITAITKAASASVTSAAHGYSVGDTVVFRSVVGMTEINDRIGVVVTVPDANTFTVNIDSTAFTAYSSAGTAVKAERFIDDQNGVLTGADGGTGTINYATGAYSVTFNANVTNAEKIVAQYYREDATAHGIADFTYSATRTAGQGVFFRQDDGGGNFMNIESFGDTEYCFHEFKTWALTLTTDDTDATNLIYRDNVGIPYHRASVATGDGVYYLDAIGENPAVRVLEYGKFLNQVVPRSISDQLDLSGYEFDQAVMFEWGQYICLGCRTQDETVNNRLFMYHKVWKSWEVHSFRVSTLDSYNGALLSGDSGSPNLYQLFDGLADDESVIENHFITGADYLDKDGVKVVNRMKVAGLIGDDQTLEVSYSLDNAPFILVKTIVGNGDYVDLDQRKVIGSTLLGEEQMGGGEDPEDRVYASPYEIEFQVGTAKFERIRLKFEAKSIGYVSVSEYGFVDIRDKGKKLPTKYIA